MDKYLYTCNYCSKTYKPNRRYKQRFCSNSCRVNSHNRKNKKQLPQIKNLGLPSEKEKKDNITWGGIGNATIANIATDVGKAIFTKEENKPATKGDLRALFTASHHRYLPVTNAPKGNNGSIAHYDTHTKTVVYLPSSSQWK